MFRDSWAGDCIGFNSVAHEHGYCIAIPIPTSYLQPWLSIFKENYLFEIPGPTNLGPRQFQDKVIQCQLYIGVLRGRPFDIQGGVVGLKYFPAKDVSFRIKRKQQFFFSYA